MACFNLQIKFGNVTLENFLRASSKVRTGEASRQWLLELSRWRLLREELKELELTVTVSCSETGWDREEQ